MSIILTQTDTTVGFLSQDTQKLSLIKSRHNTKPFIKVYNSFKILLQNGGRIPKNKKNLIRRSKKTTFIIKNRSFRIAQNICTSQILRDLKWNYSTSANEAGKNFDRDFCEVKTDIIIENKDGLIENSSSRLYKLNKNKLRRLR